MLGGAPDEVPEKYALYSPINYVHPGCPPTLLIQGEDDLITSVDATRQLYQKLVEAGVPAINVVFPQTDHGFDLALPKISPTAQSALYDIDRFLALMV
jgi:acetyl esterase/lipase